MSIVNSENLACSHADPTIKISCKLNVMCGVLSHGGVVSGLNLEPDPLTLKNIAKLVQSAMKMARALLMK